MEDHRIDFDGRGTDQLSSTMIRGEQLHYRYPEGEFCLQVPLLSISRGESVAIIGPSGSGKTTLLNLLAGIIVPDDGVIRINETTVSELDDASRRDFRIKNLGLVFQEFELLEYLNVVDNVLLPFRISTALIWRSEVRDRAEGLLEQVGLAGKRHRHPSQLSQGERQRVALCRALLPEPLVILADEPTGNLDPVNRDLVIAMMSDYARTNQSTLVTVTHEHDQLDHFQRTIDVTQMAGKEGL